MVSMLYHGCHKPLNPLPNYPSSIGVVSTRALQVPFPTPDYPVADLPVIPLSPASHYNSPHSTTYLLQKQISFHKISHDVFLPEKPNSIQSVLLHTLQLQEPTILSSKTSSSYSFFLVFFYRIRTTRLDYSISILLSLIFILTDIQKY